MFAHVRAAELVVGSGRTERLHDEVVALSDVAGADEGTIEPSEIGRRDLPDALVRMLSASRIER